MYILGNDNSSAGYNTWAYDIGLLYILLVDYVSLTILVSFVGRAYALPKSSRRLDTITSEKITELVYSNGRRRRPVEAMAFRKVFRIIAALGRGLAGFICLMKKAAFFSRQIIPPPVFPSTCGTNLVIMHSQLTRRSAVYPGTCGTEMVSIHNQLTRRDARRLRMT